MSTEHKNSGVKRILVLNYEFPPLGGGGSPVSFEIAERLSKGVGYGVQSVGDTGEEARSEEQEERMDAGANPNVIDPAGECQAWPRECGDPGSEFTYSFLRSPYFGAHLCV